jgi:hypothetical protein
VAVIVVLAGPVEHGVPLPLFESRVVIPNLRHGPGLGSAQWHRKHHSNGAAHCCSAFLFDMFFL